MHTHKKHLGIAASCLLLSTPLAHAASATTFDGQAFRVDYGVSIDDPASLFSLGHAEVTGSPSSVEVASLSKWAIDTAGNTVTFTWDKVADFMNYGSPAFIGFRISDPNGQLADIIGVTVTNTAYTAGSYGNLIEGFLPSHVTFDADNIYVNLNTSMWHAMPMASMGDPFRDRIVLSVDFQAAPIPEPETWAMLLAGLGLVGAWTRRRRSA